MPALAFDYPVQFYQINEREQSQMTELAKDILEDELFETAEVYVSGRQDGRGLRGDG